MSAHASANMVTPPVDAGRRIEQLRHILGLVEQIAARGAPSQVERAIDGDARISSAYEEASPIVRRRFDALTMETAAWAAAGIQVLLVAKADAPSPRAAAAGLADELDTALKKLSRLLV